MTDPNIDFSMVLASAVHDMKNSLGMLLNSLDELRGEHEQSLAGSDKFNMLQYEAERMHNDLVQLLGIYRLEKTISLRTLTSILCQISWRSTSPGTSLCCRDSASNIQLPQMTSMVFSTRTC